MSPGGGAKRMHGQAALLPVGREGACWSLPPQLQMPAALPPLQGNKTSNLSIVYTPASNLRKNGEMATGQVRPCHGVVAGPPAGPAGRARSSVECCAAWEEDLRKMW